MKRSAFLILITVSLQLLWTVPTKVYALGCSPTKPDDPPPAGTCTFLPFPPSSIPVMVPLCCPGFVGVRTGADTCKCEPADWAIKEFLNIANGIALPLAVIVGMFLIVLAGYKILTSQGNPTELQTGKDNLTSAIIGLIFILTAVSILRVIIKALITGDSQPF